MRSTCISTDFSHADMTKAPVHWTGAFVVRPPVARRASAPRETGERLAQWKESPQAHEPVALGLSMVKPCFSIESTKSICAPLR